MDSQYRHHRSPKNDIETSQNTAQKPHDFESNQPSKPLSFERTLALDDTRESKAFGERQSLSNRAKDPGATVSLKTLSHHRAHDESLTNVNSSHTGETPSVKWRLHMPPLDASLGAFGERKSLIEWENDPRCLVPISRLRIRLWKGWPLELALRTPLAVSSQTYEAFGEIKSLIAWARDTRCVVTAKSLQHRLENGESIEDAMVRSGGQKIKRFWE